MDDATIDASQVSAVSTARPGEAIRLPAIPSWLGSALAILFLLGSATYPLIDATSFGLGRVELTLFYMMAAIALNFVHGFGGVLMIGQPALMTVAGYTAGILSARHGWPFWATFSLAILAAVALSLFMCSPSIRVQGWYLAVLSFMAVSLVPDVVDAFWRTTGGGDGLPGVSPIKFGGWEPPIWVVYELILGVTVVIFIASRNLIKSGWGTSLLALRDHPFMATASGVRPARVRAALFALTGVPCGAAGALYAHSAQFFSASNFGPTIVLLLIGGVLLGGRGTLWGPVFGVIIFSGISLWLGPFSLYNPLILGLGVAGAALTFRLGIVGTLLALWDKHGPDKGAAARLLTVEDTATKIAPIEERPDLEVRDLSKHFDGVYALRNVQLRVRSGSIVTVIGANGSGKTTLLNCVSGFVTPDSGAVILNGRAIGGIPPHRRARLGVARTFQVPRLVEELSVLENVKLGVFGVRPQPVAASLFRTPGFRRREKHAAELALSACGTLGLSERGVSAKASELTLALKRVVEMARGLAGNASVICLDEPVAGLNVAAQRRVATVLRELANSGRAVLLIEHNLPFVLSLSDELILMKDGEVEDRGTPADAGDASRPLGRYFQTFVAKADKAKVEEAIRAAAAQQRGEPEHVKS